MDKMGRVVFHWDGEEISCWLRGQCLVWQTPHLRQVLAFFVVLRNIIRRLGGSLSFRALEGVVRVPAKIGHLLPLQARLDLPDVDRFFRALLRTG